MRKNILLVGTQTINGDTGKVIVAGEVSIIHADVQKLNGAGEIYVEDSYIGETKLVGEIETQNSGFGNLHLAGEMKCKGNCRADTMVIIGKLDAELLECRILRNFTRKRHWFLNVNNGPVSISDINLNLGSGLNKNQYTVSTSNTNEGSIFSGTVKAETFENFCDFHLDFNYKFKNILSVDFLHGNGVVECEEFYSFGELDMEGINADFIYIHPYTESKLNQVMGSDIRITEKFPMDQTFKMLPKSADLDTYAKAAEKHAGIMELDLIEGDSIILDHVKVKKVCGETITIGEECIIDCVEYKNSIVVSPNASVKEIIQL